MSDETRTVTEPRTEAGRALIDAIGGGDAAKIRIIAYVLAIEAEAAALPTSTEGLDELRILSENATPGPWVADVPGFGTIFRGESIESRGVWLFDPKDADDYDSALVVAAVNYVRSRLASLSPSPTEENRFCGSCRTLGHYAGDDRHPCIPPSS